jgi:hypothetical protein
MSPFKDADRFIQLRDICNPPLWTAQVQRMNDMIIMPFITVFLFFIGSADLMWLASSLFTAYRKWTEWNEFNDLQFKMQRMRLRMIQVGGPFIVTNDPKYMPYVWADAVVRYDG